MSGALHNSTREPEVLHSRERLQALVECTSDAIFITDFDSASFVEVNSNACNLFGYTADELRGKTGRHLHPPDDDSVVNELGDTLRANGVVARPAVRMQRKDGSHFWAELRSSIYHVSGKKLYVTFIRDVSARVAREQELAHAYERLKETQSQLIHSSRLAAVGQLAAGIAHEINNPAACLLTNLQVLKRDFSELPEANHGATTGSPGDARAALASFKRHNEHSIDDSLDAIQRIAAVVKGLRGFTRIDHDSVQVVDINEVARYAHRLVWPQVRHCAKIISELNATRPFVADRGKLVQVAVNLLMNAGQAIEEFGGGRITIRTRSTEDGVWLVVEDDGPGVPAAIAKHIFEPFYTTKPADRGTGLGLSLCADIVQQHGGQISIAHTEQSGACFEVRIPNNTGLSARQSSSPPPAEKAERARILVVDDEMPLVRAYRRSLGRAHEVAVAYSGEEALQALAQDDSYDLILCDLMMPGVDGVDVYEQLSASKPHLLKKLVFCSGGATTQRCRQFLTRPEIVFLEKPVTHEKLNRLIATRAQNQPSAASRS